MQAAGKSSFYRERFFHTHVRVSLDLLQTRHREGRFLQLCLETGQPFVVDNTNPTPADRARYVGPARAAGFRVVGYYFGMRLAEALIRNATRPEEQRIPEKGVGGTAGRLALPSYSEGFDALDYVRAEDSTFHVSPWREVPDG